MFLSVGSDSFPLNSRVLRVGHLADLYQLVSELLVPKIGFASISFVCYIFFIKKKTKFVLEGASILKQL